MTVGHVSEAYNQKCYIHYSTVGFTDYFAPPMFCEHKNSPGVLILLSSFCRIEEMHVESRLLKRRQANDEPLEDTNEPNVDARPKMNRKIPFFS